METKNKQLRKEEMSPIIIGKLLNIGAILEREGNKILLPFGLNQQQFSVFFEIGKAEKVKQKDLVNRLLLERAHVSKIVKKLELNGLLQVETSNTDKRSAWLKLTAEGTKVLNECMQVFNAWNQDWLTEVNTDELQVILNSVSKIQNIFINKVKK